MGRHTRFSSEITASVSKCQNGLIKEIDDVLVGGGTGNKDLSQRLAEEGLLPMFGFPSKVRNFYLNRPNRSYPWPPTGVIDRDSAMAVSQFAPGSEVIRDGMVYPVIGIADFRPSGVTVAPEASPLGIERLVDICRRCSYLSEVAGEASDLDRCPRCDAEPGVFQTVDLREPLGYRAGKSRDFDGNFSWSARAMTARALADWESLNPVEDSGLVARSGPGRRFVVNDNGGRMFEFQAAPASSGWGGFISTQVDKTLLYESGEGEPVSVALGAVQPTDLFFIGAKAPVNAHAGIRLNFPGAKLQRGGQVDLTHGRRAAWYSLAFLLRTVAAVQLDIQPLEFAAGIYSGMQAGEPATYAFLADTLENGAGFSTHLGEPEAFALLRTNTETRLNNLSAPEHADACDSSCYRCLRDYSNMAYHAMLDWRLAADLFAALSSEALPDRGPEEAAKLKNWCKAYGARQIDGLPAAAAVLEGDRIGKVGVIVRHPLEAAEDELIAERLSNTMAQLEYLESNLDGIVFIDSFTIERDPTQVFKMFEAIPRRV